MGNESKAIKKTDSSAIALLFDVLGDKYKDVSDIDSYYNINGHYYFLEFVKCDGNPFDYEPNENWEQIKKQITIVWEFSKKAEGTLWLICYNDSKSEFKLFKVSKLNEIKIEYKAVRKKNFKEFKVWFQRFNSEVLKK